MFLLLTKQTQWWLYAHRVHTTDCKMKALMKLISFRLFKYGLIGGLILIMTQCDNRTSSRKRFSKVMDIHIPEDIEIIKDEYQDMLQDFVIIYEIKLTNKTMSKLTKSIRESKYYNPKTYVKDYVTQEMYVKYNDMKAVWAKTDSGYIFQNDFYRDAYSAKIDTIKMIAVFNESHD